MWFNWSGLREATTDDVYNLEKSCTCMSCESSFCLRSCFGVSTQDGTLLSCHQALCRLLSWGYHGYGGCMHSGFLLIISALHVENENNL